MKPVADNDEFLWEEILEAEMEAEYKQNRRQPSTTAAEAAYRLEDIRSLVPSTLAVKLNDHTFIQFELPCSQVARHL
jgi:hypothetical protein